MIFPFVEKKWWYFLASGLIIVPGTIAILFGGLRPGIEFQSGTLIDAQFATAPATEEIEALFLANGHTAIQVQRAEGGRVQIRTATQQPDDIASSEKALAERYPGNYKPGLTQTSSVSPSFSAELVQNAALSVVFASTLIVLLIAFAFRSFGWAAFRYGIAAIFALLHDALLVLGLFAIFGIFFGIEVDSLFVTAILTVIGFSVHDTIVVFDRIRENLRLNPGEALNPIINFSVMQTLVRSFVTGVTTILVLLALFSFGGHSIRNFSLALLIGIVSGTYSSIFNAAQIVSLWQELEDRLRHRSASGPRTAPA